KPSHKLALFVVAVLVPYVGFVLCLAFRPAYIDALPIWIRWGLGCYFVASFIGLTLAIVRFRKSTGSLTQGARSGSERDTQASLRLRNVRRLLILYTILFPFGVAGVFLQRQVPIRFAVLALVVPIVIVGGLWRILSRARERMESTEGSGGSDRTL